MSTERLEPSHIKQLLLYAPDDEEVKQFQQYNQDPAKLSEPDKFVLQVHISFAVQTKLMIIKYKIHLICFGMLFSLWCYVVDVADVTSARV